MPSAQNRACIIEGHPNVTAAVFIIICTQEYLVHCCEKKMKYDIIVLPTCLFLYLHILSFKLSCLMNIKHKGQVWFIQALSEW